MIFSAFFPASGSFKNKKHISSTFLYTFQCLSSISPQYPCLSICILRIAVCSDEDDENILRAIEKNDIDSVIKLLECRIPANIKQDNTSTGLHYATITCCIKAMELLLGNASVNVDFQNKIGRTALHYAAVNNNIEAMELLLQYATENSVHVRDTLGNTPLLTAASNGSIEAVKLLLKTKAKINDINKFNYTSLHLAAMRNYVKTIEVLLQFDADPNLRDADKRRPYDVACKGNHKETVNLLKTVTKPITSCNSF